MDFLYFLFYSLKAEDSLLNNFTSFATSFLNYFSWAFSSSLLTASRASICSSSCSLCDLMSNSVFLSVNWRSSSLTRLRRCSLTSELLWWIAYKSSFSFKSSCTLNCNYSILIPRNSFNISNSPASFASSLPIIYSSAKPDCTPYSHWESFYLSWTKKPPSFSNKLFIWSMPPISSNELRNGLISGTTGAKLSWYYWLFDS